MVHQPLTFDHLPFGALDVGALQSDLGQMGFTPTAIGTCSWTLGGRAHEARALSVVFEHGYLDLIENRSPQWASHLRTSPVYGRGLAPTAIVLSTLSAEGAYDELSARGIPLHAPYSIVRELSGGHPMRLSYRIFGIDRARMQLPLAVIEDSAPHALRISSWIAHRNSVRSIAALHVWTPDLDRAVADLSAFFPDAALSRSSGAASYPIGATTLALYATPRDGFLQETSAALPPHTGPALLAVEFEATDLSAAEECLRSSGLRCVASGESIAVHAREGFGCGIIIRQAQHGRTDPRG